MNNDIAFIGIWLFGMITLFAMLFLIPYLHDYTMFFERLFGTMSPEDYYKAKDYVGLYRRLKKCAEIEIGRSERSQTGITEICRFASLADSGRWISLTAPDVVDALAYFASMKIVVDVWAKENSMHTDTNLFRVHLYHMNDHYEEVSGKYQEKYCRDTIGSQRLVQFANELKEDMSHVE